MTRPRGSAFRSRRNAPCLPTRGRARRPISLQSTGRRVGEELQHLGLEPQGLCADGERARKLAPAHPAPDGRVRDADAREYVGLVEKAIAGLRRALVTATVRQPAAGEFGRRVLHRPRVGGQGGVRNSITRGHRARTIVRPTPRRGDTRSMVPSLPAGTAFFRPMPPVVSGCLVCEVCGMALAVCRLSEKPATPPPRINSLLLSGGETR